ncbi:MAG: GAF domain-containing protein [Chloroflexi bacterium]|nr:GAF domain-containing protein [Chloroflexota bacterium]
MANVGSRVRVLCRDSWLLQFLSLTFSEVLQLDSYESYYMLRFPSNHEYRHNLEKMLLATSREGRQRLATYLRRYLSPLVVEELLTQGRLHLLTEEREVKRATVIIADVRGFTPQTLESERLGHGAKSVVELLEPFFNDATQIVFEYSGVMGEFSGDKFMAIFGIPFPRPDDADRAVLAAIDIYTNLTRLNNSLWDSRHLMGFDVGIGLHTGGPIWVGDIGSDLRRELSMIGTTINAASRVEELTKSEEFAQLTSNFNIILTQSCIDSLSPNILDSLELKIFKERPLRGLGKQTFGMSKIINLKQDLPVLWKKIDRATLRNVNNIAQFIESIRERENRNRLSQTMRGIGRAITSYLELEKILDAVLEEVQYFLNATSASILLIEESTNKLIFKAVLPEERKIELQKLDLRVGDSSRVGQIAQTGESLLLYDAEIEQVPNLNSNQETLHSQQAFNLTHFRTHSMLCAPIATSSQILGVIQVVDEQPNKFNQDDLYNLELIASFATSAICNAQQHEKASESETLAVMSVVTSDIAHDIKNDVGAILSTANTILESLNEPDQNLNKEELRADIEQILSEAQRTLDLMEEIRYPLSELKNEQVELRDIIKEAKDSVFAKFKANIVVEGNYVHESVKITTDRKRLYYVFCKVIENAVRAMIRSNLNHKVKSSPQDLSGQSDLKNELEQKIKTLNITIEHTKPSWVRVKIADTGCGISPEHWDALFGPLRQKKKEQILKPQGWGYGLWSSRLFLSSVGGNISLDKSYTQGTCILIELPLVNQYSQASKLI